MHVPWYIAGKAVYLRSYMAFCYIAHILCYIAHAYTMLYSLIGYIAKYIAAVTVPGGIGPTITHRSTGCVRAQGPDPCVCFRNQRGGKKALIGDLGGPCRLHMYLSEDAKRTLAHATSNNKNSYSISEPRRIRTVIHSVTTAERSNSAIVSF